MKVIMHQQTQILLQYNRIKKENEACRIEETIIPQGNPLLSIQEVTTAPSANIIFTWQHTGTTLLIPVVGNLVINEFVTLSPGSSFAMAATAGLQYSIQNEEQDSPCLFLQLNMNLPDTGCQFDMDGSVVQTQNKWITLATFENSVTVGMVKMSGRQEHTLPLTLDEQVAAFVINGAFEMNGCLLHRGDTLLLHAATMAEWEALSEEAIILLVQQKEKDT